MVMLERGFLMSVNPVASLACFRRGTGSYAGDLFKLVIHFCCEWQPEIWAASRA
jgi:hypothetical protein